MREGWPGWFHRRGEARERPHPGSHYSPTLPQNPWGRVGRTRSGCTGWGLVRGRSAPLPRPSPTNCVGEGGGTGEPRRDTTFSPSPRGTSGEGVGGRGPPLGRSLAHATVVLPPPSREAGEGGRGGGGPRPCRAGCPRDEILRLSARKGSGGGSGGETFGGHRRTERASRLCTTAARRIFIGSPARPDGAAQRRPARIPMRPSR